jgi:hypothetical protein
MKIADLFEVPLEEFIGARNALAKELRAAGKEDEAGQVAGLRKPPKALWLVNQLGRRAPKDVQALIEATRRIREAQEKGLTGDEVREGMRAQRVALAALTAAAGGAGFARDGRSVGGAGFARDGRSANARSIGDAASERRIHDTLQAAAMSEPDALREGRLLQELAPAGFEALLGADVQPLREPAAKVAEAKVVTASDSVKAAAAARQTAAAKKKEAARLAAHAAALEKTASKAESAAGEAEAAAEKATDAATKAAEVAAAANERAAKAREAAKTARKEAETARAAATSRQS